MKSPFQNCSHLSTCRSCFSRMTYADLVFSNDFDFCLFYQHVEYSGQGESAWFPYYTPLAPTHTTVWLICHFRAHRKGSFTLFPFFGITLVKIEVKKPWKIDLHVFRLESFLKFFCPNLDQNDHQYTFILWALIILGILWPSSLLLPFLLFLIFSISLLYSRYLCWRSYFILWASFFKDFNVTYQVWRPWPLLEPIFIKIESVMEAGELIVFTWVRHIGKGAKR